MSKFNELIKGTTPVVVEFYAEWAPSSKDVTESLKKIKDSHSGLFKMVRIDFDKNESVAAKLGVNAAPYVLLFKEGKILWKNAGLCDYDEMIEKI